MQSVQKLLLHDKKIYIIIVFYRTHLKNQGPQRMKYLAYELTIMLLAGSSCNRRVVIVKNPPATHRLPPGQAKKITGSQSARPYAPGQQKKH